ncbi:hypothetical protein TNCV_3481891 [Trichonephila clavipes]|nr:hypothetical protein TNCV_3481891 [Trichonephila clavipes]
MAEGDDDAFFPAVENQCKIIETALFIQVQYEPTDERGSQEGAGLQGKPKKTYSSVVASSFGDNEPSRKTCCSVLIAAENCNSDDVRKLFKAQINPRKEKAGIRHVKEISDNGIIVNCASEKDRDKLMTRIEANPKFLKPTNCS